MFFFLFAFIQQDSNDDEEKCPSQQQQQGENVVRHCCDSCDYSTKKSDHLNRHKKKHSWNEKFVCPRCTNSTKQQCRVDHHLIRDHLEEQKSTEVNKIGMGREDCHSEEVGNHLKKDHLDATVFRLMAQQSTSAKEKTGLADQEKSEIPSDTRFG